MGLLDNSFTPQYNEARYYGGKYSFTADSSLTVQEYTITKNFEDILRRRTGLPDARSPVPGSYKVYIENEFVIEDNDVTTSKLIMVCGRSEKETTLKSDKNEINRSFANKRLLNLANSYLENLRQETRIVFK